MDVQPIYVSGEPIVITRNIKFISIKIMSIEFNITATLLIDFFDDFNNIIQNEILQLTPEEYAQWGTDDEFIINLVCQKYNLTLVN